MGKKEMGTQFKVCFAVSFAVLLISLATNVSAAANTLDGNTNFSWTVVEFIGEEGEPLMESEVSRRLVGGTIISFGALKTGPFCDAKKYGDWIGPIGKDTRPCAVYNRCRSPA
jgi:hypothetical protein